MNNKKVAVIGGGAAGMIAAATSAYDGNETYLFEKNEKLGKKLFLTGKGRCNITNVADSDNFFRAVMRNPKFLYSALSAFDNNDIVELVNRMGIPTKVERGGRVFPESDKSSDVIRALRTNLTESGANVLLDTRILSIEKQGDNFMVEFVSENVKAAVEFDNVIIATGGVSYPSTGSTGDGYLFAERLGHTINAPKPSLIPLITREEWAKSLQGLTLKNVTLSAYRKKKQIYSELGEMLFTHFGITGPLVLTLSGIIADDPTGVDVYIDLKPGLTAEKLDKRILSDFEKFKRKQIKNSLGDLLPMRMVEVVIAESEILPEKLVDDITAKEREKLTNTLKALHLTISGTRPIDEAVITRGGVKVSEINPKTMQSKLVSGLYFAGEVIDVDAETGGYNLQIAFSTGYLAGKLFE